MKLLKEFLAAELHLDPGKYISHFVLYEKLLLEWNKKINLVSRRSESIQEHILNSIFFLPGYKIPDAGSLADIGSGGGLPGIPLKILFPEMKVLLVDSIAKKVNVLNDIIRRMKLKNTEAVWGRAGDISQRPGYRLEFDRVISKAVSTMDNLYGWGKDFLKKDGTMLFIKGGDIKNEIDGLNKMKYNFNVEVINFDYDKEYGIEDKKLVLIKEIRSE